MNHPYHIYFVCTGNACRSPLAELYLEEAFRANRPPYGG